MFSFRFSLCGPPGDHVSLPIISAGFQFKVWEVVFLKGGSAAFWGFGSNTERWKEMKVETLLGWGCGGQTGRTEE